MKALDPSEIRLSYLVVSNLRPVLTHSLSLRLPIKEKRDKKKIKKFQSYVSFCFGLQNMKTKDSGGVLFYYLIPNEKLFQLICFTLAQVSSISKWSTQ
jgi:hypothetical protein